ncbi:MAG: hypothetical protein VX829_14780 [Pseudomonadota bacterium]|nr:hypothetical protein [Pseudomonadota bacterium]
MHSRDHITHYEDHHSGKLSRKGFKLMKKVALLIAFLLLIIGALSLMPSNATITYNGEQVTGPLKHLIEAGGIVFVPILLLCMGILLAFMFTGIGLIILGFLVLFCLVSFSMAFPFLLPLLIPLFIVWLIFALTRKDKTSDAVNSK